MSSRDDRFNPVFQRQQDDFFKDPQVHSDRHSSLAPNKDDLQQRDNDLEDLLGQNYQNRLKIPELNLMVSKFSQEEQAMRDKLFYSIRVEILNNRDNLDAYDQSIQMMVDQDSRLTPERMIGLVNCLLGVKSDKHTQLPYFVKVIAYLKTLWQKLRTDTQIQKQRWLISQILNDKHPFYNIRINQQITQMLSIYLSEPQVDLDGLENILLQIFNDYFRHIEEEMAGEGQNAFYKFIHMQFAGSCFRANTTNLQINMMIVNKASTPELKQQFMKEFQQGILITQFGTMDKNELETYFVSVMQVASQNPELSDLYIFRIIQWLLGQNQQMDKKILGLKLLTQSVTLAKTKPHFSKHLITWINKHRLIDNYLRQSTHSRIIQQLPQIIHFLYDNNVLSSQYLAQLMQSALHSQDIFRIVQSMLSWLKINHLEQAFGVLMNYQDRLSTPFSQFLSAFVGSTALQKGNKRKRTVILQDNRREIDPQAEDIQVQGPGDFLVKRLMKFLVDLASLDQNLFMPALLRLISTHFKLLRPQLQTQITNLLRNNIPCAVWILEHCLKLQTAHDRGQGKYDLIIRLSAQGVYQLMLALLARHRYSRSVVDKLLAVIILFCRFHKPLQRNATQFLWKVLGQFARDERERQQFFVFLKEIVRFQGTVNEQSVNFIFFQILMGLSAQWFSLRVYDCLEMLFLRLNEDCKLLIFETDHYRVTQPPLIGTAKFWYIYFNCPDLKVTRKCRDFIHRLITHSSQTQTQLLTQALFNLRRHLQVALQLNDPNDHNKQQILMMRGFQMGEKLLLQKQRVEQQVRDGPLSLIIKDCTKGALGGQSSQTLQINQKLTLCDLRAYIGDNLNPPRKNHQIQLWNKGKSLKGQQLTLRQLKLENNNTLIVMMVDTLPLQPKEQIRKQQFQQLSQLVGNSYSADFLGFVVQKFQGENIDTIANQLFDPDRVAALQAQFSIKKQKQQTQQQVLSVSAQKVQQKKFGQLLAQDPSQIDLLLKCLKVMINKRSGWSLMKKLPLNQHYMNEVQTYVQRGQWQGLFLNKNQQQTIYIIHILTNYARQSPAKMTFLFEQKQLRRYLIDKISDVVTNNPEDIGTYQDSLKLLLLSISCPLFSHLQTYCSSKVKEEESLLDKTQKYIEQQMSQDGYIGGQFCEKLINCLLLNTLSDKMALNIVKIYLHHFNCPTSTRIFSLLKHSQLQWLLLKHGKPVLFGVVMTALKLKKIDTHLQPGKFSQLALDLLIKFKVQPKHKQNTYHFGELFECIESLLGLCPVQDSEFQIQSLQDILEHLQSNISQMLQPQIIGFLKVGWKLIHRHLKSQHGERRNDQLGRFAVWLFKQYLFGLKDTLPFFKNKNVRKAAYKLLLSLTGYHSIARQIVGQIKKLISGFQGSPKQEGEFRNTQFIGLRNLGTTCYINSLIQQLYHTIFSKLLLEQDRADNPEPIKMLQFKKIFASLYKGMRSPVSPKDYVQTVKINGEFIKTYIQQDVNQFFASLMHQVQERIGKQLLDKTISGTVCHQIRGLQQGAQVKNVSEKFLTMMVEMKGKRNLHQALAALTKPHVLQGDNMYYSQFLCRKIRASSKLFLDQLPDLLVITLKRFYWNYQTNIRNKINDYFEFPLQLDLSRYSVQGKRQDPAYFQYRLCGILIHSGSAQSGHYYSFIRVQNKWLQFNDRKVTQWDMQTNLKNDCFGGLDQRSKNAYMLFYQRVNSKTHGSFLKQLPPDNKLLQLVQQENQHFVRNRLIYDANFVDFVKEMSTNEHCKSVLDVLETLNINKQPVVVMGPVQGPTDALNDAMIQEGPQNVDSQDSQKAQSEAKNTSMSKQNEKRLINMVLQNLPQR